MNNSNEENKYFEAKKHVECVKKFYTNLMFYVIFIGFLAGLNYYTNELRNPWFLWAAFGWGIGLTIQAFKTFRWMPFMKKDWEDKKIKEIMENDDKQVSSKRWE